MIETTMDSLARDYAADHPEDAARVLAALAPEEAAPFLDSCAIEVAAGVSRYLTAQELASLLGLLSVERAATLLARLSSDQVASGLRRLGKGERERAIQGLPKDRRRAIETLLSYDEDSVGAWTEPLVLAVSKDVDAASAWETVTRNRDQLRYYVYVVDEDERLVGVIDLRTLLRADPQAKVETLMRTEVHRLSAHANREATLRHPGWQEVHALPVVDGSNTLVGVLLHETVQRLSHRDRLPATNDAPSRALSDLYWFGTQRVFAEIFDFIATEEPHDSP